MLEAAAAALAAEMAAVVVAAVVAALAMGCSTASRGWCSTRGCTSRKKRHRRQPGI